MVAAMLALALAPGWEAPTSCPDLQDVNARVAALAGRDADEDELVAHARVDGPPWRATIELRRGELVDERVIQAESCAGLVDAYAVMIAVAMDPIAITSRRVTPSIVTTPSASAPAPPRTTSPDPAPESGSGSASAPVRARARSPVHRLGVRAGAGIGAGGWERASGGVELAIAWSRNALELDLVGRYWIRRRDALDDRGAVQVELGTIGALACWLGARRRVALAGCVGVEAGDLVIAGVQAPARERVHFPWVAPLFGGRVSFTLRAPLSLWIGLEAAIPVTRLAATLRAMSPIRVYEAGSPALRALGGIELRWTIPRRP
jgi:hypothetical protein